MLEGEAVTRVRSVLQAGDREDRPVGVRGVRVREPTAHVARGLRVTSRVGLPPLRRLVRSDVIARARQTSVSRHPAADVLFALTLA